MLKNKKYENYTLYTQNIISVIAYVSSMWSLIISIGRFFIDDREAIQMKGWLETGIVTWSVVCRVFYRLPVLLFDTPRLLIQTNTRHNHETSQTTPQCDLITEHQYRQPDRHATLYCVADAVREVIVIITSYFNGNLSIFI